MLVHYKDLGTKKYNNNVENWNLLLFLLFFFLFKVKYFSLDFDLLFIFLMCQTFLKNQ